MGLFDGYFDPQQFADSGGLLGRLLSLRPDIAQNQQQDTGFDQPPSAPQAPAPTPLFWPTLPINGSTPFAPQLPAQDLHSQYQALRSALGDHNAMFVHPGLGQTLVARALVSQQGPSNSGGAPSAGDGRPVASDASPDPIRPGSQYAQAPIGIVSLDPLEVRRDQGPTEGPPPIGSEALSGGAPIGAGALLGGLFAAMLMHPGDKPESNRLPPPFRGRKTAPPISLPGVDDWSNVHAPAGEQPQNYIYSRSRQGGSGEGGDPDPDDEDCKKEKEDAIKRCTEDPWEKSVNDTGPYKKESGAPWDTEDCIRGFMSEKCGGNQRDYTPGRRRKRKQGRRW